jgi:Protein of unknown function (DUF4239)
VRFLWLYSISTWQLFALVNSVTCLISLLGCIVFRGKFDDWLGLDGETNEVVANFLAFTGVFYGIVLGLVAVGAWDTYNESSGRAEREASALAAFYRDVSQLPDPARTTLQTMTRKYMWTVIHNEWPDQQNGLPPRAGDPVVTDIGAALFAVPATTPNIQITLTQSVSQFNSVVEARRARIESVDSALPGSLWWVIIIGTLINIAMTWLLSIKNRGLDVFVNMLMATLMGTVLAFVIAMDNPYRGEISVSSKSYQLIFDRLMGGSRAMRTGH